MSRPLGSKNKLRQVPAEAFSYTTDQRIELVADLIVEKIAEDQRNGARLINILEDGHAASTKQQNP